MSDINPIKQAPVQGMTGLSGGPASLLLTPPIPLDPVYLDEVFSLYAYAGNGSSQAINNGIDLSGEGGAVIMKSRTSADASGSGSPAGYGWGVHDTVRGKTKNQQLQTYAVDVTYPNAVSSFNSNGFTLGDATYNYSSQNFISYTFRKAKGFFDCFTYAGDDTSSRVLSHDLGSSPGMVWIKKISGSIGGWSTWHKEKGFGGGLLMNSAGVGFASPISAVSSTTITLTSNTENSSGINFLVYLFADDAAEFGDELDQSIIKCGKYTGNGSTTGPTVNLGWEPQVLFCKNIDSNSDWAVNDTIRGIATGGQNDPVIWTNRSYAEDTTHDALDLSATGFQLKTTDNDWNTNGDEYVYMAIRRLDGYVSKPATAGTDVFAITSSSASASIPCFVSGFPVDFGMIKNPTYTATWYQTARLMGLKHLVSADSSAESNMSWGPMDSNKGWGISFSAAHDSWMWKRGRGFDVVTWDGTGANNTLNHSLGKTPEMIWAKARSESQSWVAYHKGLNSGTTPWNWYVTLDGTGAEANWAAWVQAPTSTQFSIISNWSANSQNYIAMLFASVDGISKLGHYTGDGTTNGSKEITLGFAPKFLMLRSTAAGDWLIFDTFRGFYYSSASAAIKLNENAYAQSFASETVRKTNTGFTLWSADNSINANGVDVIYYAHV